MKIYLQQMSLCLICLFPAVCAAQLTVSSPVSRIVYQRNQFDEATILITGVAPAGTTTVEARFVPMAIGQGDVTAWTSLALLPSSVAFRGSVVVTKGQYRLDVRAKTNNSVVAETHVNRVGVGEVFVIAGQSNVYGGLQRVPNSEEDRVSCVDFQQDSLCEQLLPLRFSNVSYGSNIGPSQPPHLWSILGDRLVRRLNVPVLFLGAALGGTSSDQWKQSASGNLGSTTLSSVYRQLGVALLHYVSRTGARAILWHQGESDQLAGTSTQTYFNNIQYVINKSRQQTDFARLAWVVSRASYMQGQTSPAVIAAQNQLIAQVSDVFAGPATDSIVGAANRPDGTHLLGDGLYRFVYTWEQCLNTTFFANSVPFTPADESTFITSGYTLPLTRRPGEIIHVASLRADAHDPDNQYIAQILRADNNATVYQSAPTTANPILVTLPNYLPDGFYRMRTLSTHPATTGTLGEAFQVQHTAPLTSLQAAIPLTITGGTPDAALQRVGYRYEPASHGFYAMVKATNPMEIRIERIDGGSFTDTGWYLIPPSSAAPDYTQFADFNYIRNYPPVTGGVGGIEPGRYRLSIRPQGNTGAGVWFETTFLNGRNILYYPMEPIGPIPPVLSVDGATPKPPCLTGPLSVSINVTDGVMNSGNVFTVQLSDSDGSFSSWTAIGSGTTTPLSAILPASLSPGSNYRIRVVGSNPAVISAPSVPMAICADLSLGMRVSSRAPVVGQVISVTLSVANDGPQSTSSVRAQSVLPAGLMFVDSPTTAVSATNSTVTIEAGTLSAGSVVPYVFRVKAIQPGGFVTSAQVVDSQVFDPDSQPNSGTGDGEDDAVSVDLRTANGSGPLTTSPNPNQTPLPAVLLSQPPTDPAKADLSLLVNASNLTAASDSIVSLTITASNGGWLAAHNVQVQMVMPSAWQLTSTTGLIVNGQIVTASVGFVSADGSANVVLTVRINGSGMLNAQILSADEADPDSTPGNGYSNGEDDEARISVRLH